jgi:hypothetical protein
MGSFVGIQHSTLAAIEGDLYGMAVRYLRRRRGT